MFRVTITGLEQIRKEYGELNEKQHIALWFAVSNINTNYLPTVLKRHIREDVYNAYRPRHYNRRKANGGLIDLGENVTPVSSGIGLEYNPKGTPFIMDGEILDHSVKWALRDGDDLIRRIQKGGDEYTWKTEIEGRPFWNNFVGEVEQNIMKKIATEMQRKNVTITLENTDKVSLRRFKL